MRRGRDKDKSGEKPGMNREDFRLWKEFTRDIDPLEEPDWAAMEALFDDAAPPHKPAHQERATSAKNEPTKRMPTPAAPAAQAPQLDLRTELRLRRGQMPIDGKLDLHGYNQEQAHGMLNDFLMTSHRSGRRCVLVITGKGRGGLMAKEAYAPDLQPGILKQKLPQWLSMAPLRDIVLKALPAMPKDGGGGACYIYLRRNRDYTY